MKKTKKIVLFATSILMLIAVLSIGAFALYSSKTSGQNEAHTAPFVVSANLKANDDISTIELATTGTQEMGTLSVSNTENGITCGVNTKYTLQLNSNVSLPDTVMPTLKLGESVYSATQVDSSRKTFVFESDDFVLGFEQPETKTYTVVLSWQNTAGGENMSVSITSSVTAEQLD